jgi:phospholipid/cholesterol/gamma-HCH transport system ATP-binding protein
VTAVLEIDGALPAPDASAIAVPLTLRLDPGQAALVDVRAAPLIRALTELCAGLPALAAGAVRLLGQDLAALKRRAAEALRGRIGLAPGEGGWLPHLPTVETMLLHGRHHGADAAALRRAAEALARDFGLEGLPRAKPHELSRLELARAGCVRAFLGEPVLILLESPLDLEVADALAEPIAAAMRPALARGAAALWMTRSRRAWSEPGFPVSHRLRLDEHGLAETDRPAEGPPA